MIRSRIISLIMLIGAVASYAQSSTDAGLGVKLAWDYTVPSTNVNGLNSRGGLSAAIVYDLPLAPKWFLEPGVGLFYDKMYAGDYAMPRHRGIINGQIRNYGLRVPVVVGYRLGVSNDITVSVFAGPQVNVGFGCKIHYDDKGIADVNLYDHGWHHIDMQALAGLKFNYQDNIFAEVTGALGLTNMLKGPHHGDHLYRNLVTIGVGYKF